jgi:hypothetical protein
MPTREPDDEPVDEMTQSEALGDEKVRVDQQNTGPGSQRGGGEFPDPDTPPSEYAPGEEGVTHQEHGKGQFQGAYDEEQNETPPS